MFATLYLTNLFQNKQNEDINIYNIYNAMKQSKDKDSKQPPLTQHNVIHLHSRSW